MMGWLSKAHRGATDLLVAARFGLVRTKSTGEESINARDPVADVFEEESGSGVHIDLWIPRLANDTATFLAALPLKRPDIFGRSTGGLVAHAAALLHPGSVRRIVLTATAGGGAPGGAHAAFQARTYSRLSPPVGRERCDRARHPPLPQRS